MGKGKRASFYRAAAGELELLSSTGDDLSPATISSRKKRYASWEKGRTDKKIPVLEMQLLIGSFYLYKKYAIHGATSFFFVEL